LAKDEIKPKTGYGILMSKVFYY